MGVENREREVQKKTGRRGARLMIAGAVVSLAAIGVAAKLGWEQDALNKRYEAVLPTTEDVQKVEDTRKLLVDLRNTDPTLTPVLNPKIAAADALVTQYAVTTSAKQAETNDFLKKLGADGLVLALGVGIGEVGLRRYKRL